MPNSLLYQDQPSRPLNETRVRNFLQRTVFLILLISLLIVGIVLRINSLANVPMRSPDEGVYTYQAKTVTKQGIEGIKSLVREYNMTKEAWVYPTATRVGYILPLAAVMKMTNNTSVKVGVYISCSFSIILLLLLIILGLRFFNRWITLFALLFMSVSPMALAITRRTWQDAMLGCLGLLLIYFCCEITRATHKIIWYVPFIVVGSYCILIKESGAVIYGLCIGWLLWILLVRERSVLKGILLITFSALGVGISVAFLAYVAGGISAVMEVLTHFKESMQTNIYASEYCSGPWYQFFEMLWILSPVNTVLYFIGSIGAVFLLNDKYQKTAISPINQNRNAIFGIVFFMIALMAVLFLAKEHSLNLRFVSVLYVPFYLISGLGLWCIILFARKILKNFSFSIVIGGIVAVIIIAAINDYQNFKKVIVRSGIKDLSIRLLRESSR